LSSGLGSLRDRSGHSQLCSSSQRRSVDRSSNKLPQAVSPYGAPPNGQQAYGQAPQSSAYGQQGQYGQPPAQQQYGGTGQQKQQSHHKRGRETDHNEPSSKRQNTGSSGAGRYSGWLKNYDGNYVFFDVSKQPLAQLDTPARRALSIVSLCAPLVVVRFGRVAKKSYSSS